jgi:ribosomal protein L16/L10AE
MKKKKQKKLKKKTKKEKQRGGQLPYNLTFRGGSTLAFGGCSLNFRG